MTVARSLALLSLCAALAAPGCGKKAEPEPAPNVQIDNGPNPPPPGPDPKPGGTPTPPAPDRKDEAAKRLKQIGLALHNWESALLC